MTYDHDALVQALALKIEKDPRYSLVKFFVPWGDRKSDLIGPFYPDVTCLRREGRVRLLIEVLTPGCFEDPDEVRRLEGLSEFCVENGWEYYLACADARTQELAQRRISGRNIRPKEVWMVAGAPFGPGGAQAAKAAPAGEAALPRGAQA